MLSSELVKDALPAVRTIMETLGELGVPNAFWTGMPGNSVFLGSVISSACPESSEL